MKTCLKNIIIFVAILTIALFAGQAFAQVPKPNFVMGVGTFDFVYDDMNGYGTLSLTLGSINSVTHADGSIGLYPMCFGIPNCSVDPIYGGSVTFATFENSGGDNWTFVSTSSSGSEFNVQDANSETRLTADISQFTVDKTWTGSTYVYEVNAGFNEGNVGPITTYSGSASQFIDDVNSFSPPWGELYLKFNFTGDGPHNFKATESGTITGTFAVVPEPVSSVLLISGGTALAFRRFIKTKKK